MGNKWLRLALVSFIGIIISAFSLYFVQILNGQPSQHGAGQTHQTGSYQVVNPQAGYGPNHGYGSNHSPNPYFGQGQYYQGIPVSNQFQHPGFTPYWNPLGPGSNQYDHLQNQLFMMKQQVELMKRQMNQMKNNMNSMQNNMQNSMMPMM